MYRIFNKVTLNFLNSFYKCLSYLSYVENMGKNIKTPLGSSDVSLTQPSGNPPRDDNSYDIIARRNFTGRI